MKVSIYLKKQASLDDELSRSNLCFRVRERSVDIKVVSELVVYDKYWNIEALQYKRTTIVPVIEQKRIAEQIASIIEAIERTYSDKADSTDYRKCAAPCYCIRTYSSKFAKTHPGVCREV